MVISLKKHFASEKRSLAYCIENYPYHEAKARDCIAQLSQVISLNGDSRILEIGAAQGSLLIALKRLGYCCEGLEPCEEAIEVSKGLSAQLHTNVSITKGYAERLPYGDAQFDCVMALYVMEHVRDAQKVFEEAFRVIRPGGVFYFSTTNSLCPQQGEIRFLPFFSWYPDRLKVRIMEWAKVHWPSLVGYTDAPAINWFTPRKATRMLMKAGFARVYDTWDVITPPASPYMKKRYMRMAVRMIKLSTLTRRLADIFIPAGVQFIAVKEEC